MNSPAYEAARKKAEAMLATMTLTEKTGQLSQFGTSIYSDDEQTFDDHFAEGKVGSYLTIKGAARTNSIQRDLMKATRLPIPALFADDSSHIVWCDMEVVDNRSVFLRQIDGDTNSVLIIYKTFHNSNNQFLHVRLPPTGHR